MRIERCSDSELHCFLSKEDLEARNLRLDALAYGNPETSALIHDLLNWATYKFNFNPDHIPLMIEAVPVAEDTLLIIVKTVSYPEEMDSRFSDFLDSPDGSIYADEGEDFEDDDDFWADDEEGYPFPGSSAPLPPPVPKNAPKAHEIIEQFTDNTAVLKEASDAISKLAEGVLAAAGQTEAAGDGEAAEGNSAGGKKGAAGAGATAAGTAGDAEPAGASASPGDAEPAGASASPGSAEPAGASASSGGAEPAGASASPGSADAGKAALPGAPREGQETGETDSSGNAVSGEVVDAAELAKEAARAVGAAGAAAPAAAPAGNGGSEKGIPAITAENFAEVLQKVLEAARRSGSTANYIRMFRFDSLDAIADIAPFVASFYRGVNYLYKDGSVYHLLVSMDGESPLNYNKLINILNEFGVPEPVNVETTSFLDEHDNLILAGHAIQKLAEVAGGKK